MTHNRRKTLLISIPLMLLGILLLLETGYQTWSISAICPKCLQHAYVHRATGHSEMYPGHAKIPEDLSAPQKSRVRPGMEKPPVQLFGRAPEASQKEQAVEVALQIGEMLKYAQPVYKRGISDV